MTSIEAIFGKFLRLGAIAVVVGALLLTSACRSAPPEQPTPPSTQTPEPTVTPEPTPTPEPTTSPVATPTPMPTRPSGPGLAIRIYLVRDQKIGVAGRTVPAGVTAVAKTAMLELLKAPSGMDQAYSLDSAIPSGTKLLGLNIKNGIATVDLSGTFESGSGEVSMELRVAQVVYTLTQFATVRRVAFRIDGQPQEAIGAEGVAVSPPVNRADFEDVTPPILVEVPVPGQVVSRPIRIAGTADVFEAQFNAILTSAKGPAISREIQIHATSGSGTRGTFSTLLAYSAKAHGAARVQVFDRSEVDGSPEDLVAIPVYLP